MPIIREVMTRRPTAILETASVRAALAAMTELDVRHLPVVNPDHEVVGILSDRDLRGLPLVHRAADLPRTDLVDLDAPVSSIMSSNVISLEADDDLEKAVELMLEERIGAVPVVTPSGRLLGIVSYIDALRAYRSAAVPA
jgi:CBS domain-containing protein